MEKQETQRTFISEANGSLYRYTETIKWLSSSQPSITVDLTSDVNDGQRIEHPKTIVFACDDDCLQNVINEKRTDNDQTTDDDEGSTTSQSPTNDQSTAQ